MSALIEIDKLSKYFGGHKAVNGVSLKVQRGEVLGFLGPNGAGKSTTMRMITGFLAPTSGTVTIDGLSVDEHIVEVRQRIGYLPEGAPLYPDMTARQLLHFVGRIRHMPKTFFNTQFEKVVTHLSLEEVLNQPIDTLSKGFKRRVGLAQAILHDPDILILDEPTDGLDPLQKQEVRRLIAAMKDEKAIIISTHILEEVDAVCTRAAIIASGTIRADGTPKQLREQFKQDDLNAIFCAIAKNESQRDAAAGATI